MKPEHIIKASWNIDDEDDEDFDASEPWFAPAGFKRQPNWIQGDILTNGMPSEWASDWEVIPTADGYEVFFSGILVRKFVFNSKHITCFFERPAEKKLSKDEIDELNDISDRNMSKREEARITGIMAREITREIDNKIVQDLLATHDMNMSAAKKAIVDAFAIPEKLLKELGKK